jgi:hypothetical protein
MIGGAMSQSTINWLNLVVSLGHDPFYALIVVLFYRLHIMPKHKTAEERISALEARVDALETPLY